VKMPGAALLVGEGRTAAMAVARVEGIRGKFLEHREGGEGKAPVQQHLQTLPLRELSRGGG